MEADLRQHLLTCAQAYAVARNIKLSTLGRLAAGDWRFFDRIEGASFTARKYDEVIQWFSDHWPHATAWPDGFERPAPATKEAA